MNRWVWPAITLAVLVLVAGLGASGYLDRYERAFAESRARLLHHEVESDIVIVGIDARSLQELREWPWPRRHHARLLDQLRLSEPKRVFVDIDFSSESNAVDDAQLESALTRWRQGAIVLPAFFQKASGSDTELLLTRPLDRFARHTVIASVILQQDSDGLVSGIRSSWEISGQPLPSVVPLMSQAHLPPQRDLPIDFSIAPSSFNFVSYSDVLAGRVAPSDFSGKLVFIGATAIELGDMVPVPVHRSLPGVVVQALATESVRRGPLRTIPQWLRFTVLAAYSALCATVFRRENWRRNLFIVCMAFSAIVAVSVYLYAVHRIVLEVVPLWLVTGLVFLAGALRSLDQQTLRALGYALGLRRRDALLESIVTSSIDCIICVNANGTIRTANAAASRTFGGDFPELLGAPLARFIPELAGANLESLTGAVSEWQAVTSAGGKLAVELSLSRVNADDEPVFTAIIRDISERKSQQELLRHQATHDPLTGLPNRVGLSTYFDTALSSARSPGFGAFLLLDLRRFKEVNDTLGHVVGDHVLCEVAKRFRATIDDRGFVARIGGDEFAVVLDSGADRATVELICESLHARLREPIEIAGIALEVGLSIGIALYSDDESAMDAVLRRADVAMYVAKRRGTSYEWYDESLDEHSVRRLTMLTELRSAVVHNGIRLHYQPQVNLKTGFVDGVEALLRWQHAKLGAVSPAEFVSLAEMTDVIVPLTEWTLHEALSQLSKWRRDGLGVTMSVNLSARMLQDVAFPTRLRKLLEACEIPPHALDLEITESAMMIDPARALRVMNEIHELGVLSSIDDFGTGFSSLGYLRSLPVHVLKIDKSFVMGMRAHPGDRVIVESTLHMAHALDLHVVAEGVESEWEASFLAAGGCDVGQGFWFSKALPAEQCLAWIKRNNSTVRGVNDQRSERLGNTEAKSSSSRFDHEIVTAHIER